MTEIKEPKPTYRTRAKPAKRREARTNIVLNMDLVEQAKAKSNARTTREVVNAALEHYVKPYDYSEIMELYGTDGIDDSYHPRAPISAKFLGWSPVYGIDPAWRKPEPEDAAENAALSKLEKYTAKLRSQAGKAK